MSLPIDPRSVLSPHKLLATGILAGPASAPVDKRASARKMLAIGIVGAVSLFLAAEYATMLKPAAAREIDAACKSLRPSPTNPTLGQLPAQALDFVVQDHTGKTVSLSDYRGKVVFLNFWATWCNVCKSEKPGLEQMAREMAGDDLAVLSLASDPGWDEIREQFPHGTPLEILLDPPDGTSNLGKVARAYGITAVPESFVIDRDGRLLYYFINKRDWDSDVAQTCLQAVIDGVAP